MEFFISPEIRRKSLDYDVRIEAGVSAGLLSPRHIAIESPSRLSRGIYDINLVGAYTYFGANCMFYYVDVIGRFCSIASDVHAGYAEHPAHFLSAHPIFQADPAWTDSASAFFARNEAMIRTSQQQRYAFDQQRFGKIQIGNDVWIGQGVFIRRGVQIGDGAVIGARSVITRDVPPYAIVGGAPAKIIRYRFEPEIIEELLDLQWWRYGLSALEGVDFTSIDMALWIIRENIASGKAAVYRAPIVNVAKDAMEVLEFDPETGVLAAGESI